MLSINKDEEKSDLNQKLVTADTLEMDLENRGQAVVQFHWMLAQRRFIWKQDATGPNRGLGRQRCSWQSPPAIQPASMWFSLEVYNPRNCLPAIYSGRNPGTPGILTMKLKTSDHPIRLLLMRRTAFDGVGLSSPTCASLQWSQSLFRGGHSGIKYVFSVFFFVHMNINSQPQPLSIDTLTQTHTTTVVFLFALGTNSLQAAVPVWQQPVNDLTAVFASRPNNRITLAEVFQRCRHWACTGFRGRRWAQAAATFMHHWWKISAISKPFSVTIWAVCKDEEDIVCLIHPLAKWFPWCTYIHTHTHTYVFTWAVHILWLHYKTEAVHIRPGEPPHWRKSVGSCDIYSQVQFPPQPVVMAINQPTVLCLMGLMVESTAGAVMVELSQPLFMHLNSEFLRGSEWNTDESS